MFAQVDERALLIDWMKQYGAPREWVAQYSNVLSQPPLWGEQFSPYEQLSYDQGWYSPYQVLYQPIQPASEQIPVSEAGISPIILLLMGGGLVYWIWKRKSK
jgi:hypothetical protein